MSGTLLSRTALPFRCRKRSVPLDLIDPPILLACLIKSMTRVLSESVMPIAVTWLVLSPKNSFLKPGMTAATS